MKHTTDEMLAGLLAAYAADRSVANRNAIVEACLYLVHGIAKQIKKSMPRADFDDIRSAGSIGLIEAVERFDPTRGSPFRSFAGLRVRGAMIDHIRYVDPLARHTRQRHTRWLAATDTLRALLGREPMQAEVEATLKLGPGQWREDVTTGDRLRLSLDHVCRPFDGGEGTDIPFDHPDVGHEIAAADEFDDLIEHSGLSGKERTALRMKYGDDELQRVIADRLGENEGSMSMLLKRARMRVAERLAA